MDDRLQKWFEEGRWKKGREEGLPVVYYDEVE